MLVEIFQNFIHWNYNFLQCYQQLISCAQMGKKIMMSAKIINFPLLSIFIILSFGNGTNYHIFFRLVFKTSSTPMEKLFCPKDTDFQVLIYSYGLENFDSIKKQITCGELLEHDLLSFEVMQKNYNLNESKLCLLYTVFLCPTKQYVHFTQG